ncbi:MAG: glycine dehydrogenase, partial [Proteiniclasticum sp.]|nr:glycine dehydrogenase [Proteiniclasticum sp.]
MHPYLPNTPEDVQEMLGVIGVESTEALFKSIPDNVRLQKDLNLPKSKSEIEVRRIVSALASKNESVDELTCFLGAGSYDHYIPSIIRTLVTRSEFYTAYTPY